MDRRGTSKRLLPLAVFALSATSCMNDAKSWMDDMFTSAPKPRPIDELVEPNVDISSRDLFYGVGGKKLAPRTDVAYRFLEKDTNGMSDNFDVEDPSGRRWDAKFGREAKSEVAASRLLWAVGFYQPPVYHVSAWRIEGGSEAGPQPEARFRYQDPTWKGDGMWSWRENPFLGTRELNGLIVMNVLINNWDVKASNNKRYEREGQTPRRVYVVKDLGQSFGRTVGLFFLGSQSNPDDFAKEPFIRQVDGDDVEFGFQPIILNPGVGNGIHVEDVLWTCRRLAQLSDEQLRDAFRAAGYTDAEVTSFAAQLKRKIQEGLALEQRARS